MRCSKSQNKLQVWEYKLFDLVQERERVLYIKVGLRKTDLQPKRVEQDKKTLNSDNMMALDNEIINYYLMSKTQI